jgi:hypothetical protein
MKDPPRVSKANLTRPDSSTATFPAIEGLELAEEGVPKKDDSAVRSQRAGVVGALSLFLASVAAICLSFPILRPLTLTLTAVAIGCGLLGLVGARTRGRMTTAFMGVLVSLVTLLIAKYSPYLLTMYPPPELAQKDAAPVDTRPIVAVSLDGQKEESLRGWIDASKFCVQQGDFRVHVLSAVVRLGLEGRRVKASQPLLHISLQLSNVGSGKTITYQGWGPPQPSESPAAALRDNTGRLYKPSRAAPLIGGGSQRALSMAPRGQTTDILVYEPPADTVEYLRLELPAAAAGGAGVLHFQIPKQMIEWRLPQVPADDDP